ncbi:GNAT family N-acetyltransferase [Aurantiacibacter suaedae]|uniref:GNAT family N-acetyltransferase n=1 Tax=Aurantiacibacter suaedae TaxID=2545755 RepID=UPI0013867DDA|nr:GNAT family N-acetyltransferase [Aurantiacibacter suaedae]
MLRPIFPEDWRELFASIADKRVVRMLASAPWPYTVEDARSFCDQPRRADEMLFAITLPGEDGAPLIGTIGLAPAEPETAHELGYWIAPSHQRRGYGSEAVGAVLATARALGVSEATAGHFVDNPVSGKVLQKWGFQRESKLAQTASAGRGGQTVPTQRYRLTIA